MGVSYCVWCSGMRGDFPVLSWYDGAGRGPGRAVYVVCCLFMAWLVDNLCGDIL